MGDRHDRRDVHLNSYYSGRVYQRPASQPGSGIVAGGARANATIAARTSFQWQIGSLMGKDFPFMTPLMTLS